MSLRLTRFWLICFIFSVAFVVFYVERVATVEIGWRDALDLVWIMTLSTGLFLGISNAIIKVIKLWLRERSGIRVKTRYQQGYDSCMNSLNVHGLEAYNEWNKLSDGTFDDDIFDQGVRSALNDWSKRNL